MDVLLYDVYLTGKLADDVSPALAAQRLAALFKSTPEAMAGLITGKPQLLKRGIDKNAALKYREALQKAGCEVAFKAQTGADTKDNPTHAAQPVQAAPTTTMQAPTAAAGLQLAPVGEDLLRADERHTATSVAVETAHLGIAPLGPLPVTAAAPIITPDISHLSVVAAQGNLLRDDEKASPPAIAPDIGDLSLAEAGALIETLKSEATPLHPDTSGLELAPAGSDILTPEQRQHAHAPAPNTDHISLAPQAVR